MLNFCTPFAYLYLLCVSVWASVGVWVCTLAELASVEWIALVRWCVMWPAGLQPSPSEPELFVPNTPDATADRILYHTPWIVFNLHPATSGQPALAFFILYFLYTRRF